MGLVDMHFKLQSITFSHNKTNLDPSESLFFPAKPAGVHTHTHTPKNDLHPDAIDLCYLQAAILREHL